MRPPEEEVFADGAAGGLRGAVELGHPDRNEYLYDPKLAFREANCRGASDSGAVVEERRAQGVAVPE